MVRRILIGAGGRGAIARERTIGGDFQMHSRGSDGADTIEALAQGLHETRLSLHVRHRSLLRPAHRRWDEHGRHTGATRRDQHAQQGLRGEFQVLKGIEANILQDGTARSAGSRARRNSISWSRRRIRASGSASTRHQRMLTAVSLPGRSHPRSSPRPDVQLASGGHRRLAGSVQTSRGDTGWRSKSTATYRAKTSTFGSHCREKAGCVFALDSDAHAANQLWMADYAIAHARLAGIPSTASSIAGPSIESANGRELFAP